MQYINTTLLDVSHEISLGQKGYKQALKEWLNDFLVDEFSKEYDDAVTMVDVLEKVCEQLRIKNPQSELDLESNYD